jgi:hypothetical protein
MPSPKSENRSSKWLAYILDDFIKIPGTKLRIGLDPLIGLIPGAGDFVTSAAGLTILAAGAKKKVPLSIYLRMTSNWTLNALIGAIPFVGDLFSFWFKSNQRNYHLLRAHLDDSPTNSKGSWLPLVILIFAVLLVFTLIGLFAFWSWKTFIS